MADLCLVLAPEGKLASEKITNTCTNAAGLLLLIQARGYIKALELHGIWYLCISDVAHTECYLLGASTRLVYEYM